MFKGTAKRALHWVLPAAMAVAPVLSAAPASATLVVQYALNGGVYATLGGGATGSIVSLASSTLGGISLVGGNFGTNAPNINGTVAQAESQTFRLTNTSSTTQTISFVLADDGFVSPVAPPLANLWNALDINGIVNVAGSTASMYSCATSGATIATVLTTACNGYKTPTATINLVGGSQSTNTNLFVSLLTAPYEISEFLTINLAAGASLGVTGSTTLFAVPEPASLAILGIGLGGLGVLSRRRARKPVSI